MHRMDANPCAWESWRSHLSHAQGFMSKSLTVASEYSFEITNFLEFPKFSPEFTAFSCVNLEGDSDQSSSISWDGVHFTGTNSCALERPRSQLSHAQGFTSKSLTIASEYSIENALFSEIKSGNVTNITPRNDLFWRHQESLSKIQNQRHFFSKIRNILRQLWKILKKIQSFPKWVRKIKLDFEKKSRC